MRLLNSLAAILLVVILGITSPRNANAQIQLTPRACQTYAVWSGNLVWASQLGADKEKARADLLAQDRKMPSSIYALMLNELDALWTTAAPWEDVIVFVFNDCLARRGRYESG